MTRRQRKEVVEARADLILTDEPSVKAYAAYFETQIEQDYRVTTHSRPLREQDAWAEQDVAVAGHAVAGVAHRRGDAEGTRPGFTARRLAADPVGMVSRPAGGRVKGAYGTAARARSQDPAAIWARPRGPVVVRGG